MNNIKICLNCNKILLKKNRCKKFCSNACQGKFKRKESIRKWIESGTCANSTHKNSYVKIFLLKEQNNCCAICGNKNTWYNKELILILDHVNGPSYDNKRENLRLICPNCDSQLPTFKSRNKGNGRAKRRQRYIEHKTY